MIRKFHGDLSPLMAAVLLAQFSQACIRRDARRFFRHSDRRDVRNSRRSMFIERAPGRRFIEAQLGDRS